MKESDIRPQALFDRYLELSRQDIAVFFADHEQFATVPCPACGEAEVSLAFKKFGFQYVTCDACGSLFNSPRPTQAMIDRYYRESTAVKFWATTFYKETEAERRARLFVPRAELVHELARKYELAGTTFVDIGCGYGVLLEEVARQPGFETVIGIDLSPDLAQVCRDKGFFVIKKKAEEVLPSEVTAGVATSFEVLEHLYNPTVFLKRIRDLLLPAGILLLTTLTCSGFDIQVLWEHSKSVYPPHHINLISVEGMIQLVTRSGFELADLSTPGELDVDIVRNTVTENPAIDLPRFVRQIIDSPDEGVSARFQQFLKANRLSSHIRVVAQCPVSRRPDSDFF